MTINNLGQLVQSLGGASDSQDIYISLLSVANCGGRIFYGWASDRYASRLARPGWLAVLVANMAGAMALFAVVDLNSLYAACLWAGFTYGGFWSLGPALFGERFGSVAFASIYSLTAVSTAMGGYALNTVLAAGVYQRHASAGNPICLGIECFRTTFVVLAGLNAAGALLGGLLMRRMAPCYTAQGAARPYWEIARAQPPTAMARAVERMLRGARKGSEEAGEKGEAWALTT